MHLWDRVRRWAAMAGASVILGAVPVAALGAASSTPAGATTSTVVASPTTLDFGNVTLGDFTVKQFTLTNTGATTITFSGIIGMGGDSNDFATSPEGDCTSVDSSGNVTMAAGDVCTIDVAFAPGALGARSTVLILAHSGYTTDSVGVSGAGTIGYYQVGAEGTVGYAGDANFFGDASTTPLNHPIVGMAVTGDDGGYWLVASDGGVFNYGPSAGFHGSAGAIALNKPIVGMAATADAGGYWLVASDGGIFDYGDAGFYGSAGSIRLNKPIVGMAPTPDGGGYWLVASDGGIFNYGGRELPRLCWFGPAQQADRRHGPDPRQRGLLAGRLRRRGLLLRRCPVLRLHRSHPPRAAHHRNPRHARRAWLLVQRGRRWPVQLRHRTVPRQRGRAADSGRSSAWRPTGLLRRKPTWMSPALRHLARAGSATTGAHRIFAGP